MYIQQFFFYKLSKHITNNSEITKNRLRKILTKTFYKKELRESTILILSTQYPRYGGGATIAYELHKYFLKNNLKSICVFADNTAKKYGAKIGNPDNVSNVFFTKLKIPIKKEDYLNLLTMLNNKFGNIDLILGFNYISPYLGKVLFINSIVFYMITGFRFINDNNAVSALEMLNISDKQINGFLDNIDKYEELSLEYSDFIIPNSYLIKNLFEKFFTNYKYKISDYLDLNDVFCLPQIENIKDKNFDILFICSNFKRNVKNIKFIKNLYFSPYLKNYKKALIGKDSNKYINNHDDYNILHLGFVDKIKLENILSHTKIIIIPSLIESYSLTAIEGTNANTIVLTNTNCGISYFVNKFFVLNNNSHEWIYKIQLILENYEYFKNIFYNNYKNSLSLFNYFTNFKYKNHKKNIIFASIDCPNIGGASTNTYRLYNELKNNIFFNTICIFFYDTISTNESIVSNFYDYRNIFCIPYTTDQFDDMTKLLRDKIISIYGFIDIIFCKNYKIVNIIKQIFPDSKIIFSPSGLSGIHKSIENKYVLDIDFKQQDITGNIKEMESLNKCDYILCNSMLTHNIIYTIIDDKSKLLNPINLSNIIYEKIETKRLSERKYDIGFCAYNWKRSCKNIMLVKVLLNYYSNYNYKCIIIGKGYNNLNDNITYLKYVNQEDISAILENIKVLVVPSRYDSSPNILVEALKYGCQIITSKNVGNYDLLPQRNVVIRYDKSYIWIEKINVILNEIHSNHKKMVNVNNNIEDKDCIRQKLSNAFNSILSPTINHTVGIYKIPSIINDNYQQYLKNRYSYLSKHNFYYKEIHDEKFVKNIIYYDIFFKITEQISHKYCSTICDYIIVNFDSPENYKYPIFKIIPYYSCNINIWVLKDIESLYYFSNADIYFLRGSYNNFYTRFIPKNCLSFYYSATSLPLKMDNIKKPYSKVLIHENEEYQQIFKDSEKILFKKFASDLFVNLHLPREFDIIYIFNQDQPTKNDKLFYNFLQYLDQQELQRNILLVNDVLHHTNIKSYKFIKIVVHNHVDNEDLLNLYNISRVNLLVSGRDAFPRVIVESGYCGCYNIALDTISDGKYYYEDEMLGKLISMPNVQKIKTKHHSQVYNSNDELFSEIDTYVMKEYNHIEISVTCKQRYNCKELIDSL